MTTTRGTSNSNDRGSAEQRRRRKGWLIQTYAADRALIRVLYQDGRVEVEDFVLTPEQQMEFPSVAEAEYVPTARCYRCGRLLWFETLTVDRIIPGCKGGKYVRTNIRPACGLCNSETGGPLANGSEHQAAKRAARRRKAKTS